MNTFLPYVGVAVLVAIFAILAAGAFCLTGEDPKDEADEATE